MSLLILVVDDKPDVEIVFRQQFRRELRAARFTMEFAQSAPVALRIIGDAEGASLILILSDINMPGMSGLDQRYGRRRHFFLGPYALYHPYRVIGGNQENT